MESNSQGFIDAIRCFYMPRLVQKIEQNSSSSTTMDYQPSGACSSTSPFETTTTTTTNTTTSPFPQAKLGADHSTIDHHQSYMDYYSRSSTSPTSLYSSESSQALNPLEASNHPSNPPMICKDNSVVLSSDNWYYDMQELPSMSAIGQCPDDVHMADQSWISCDMADGMWNIMDGLW